MFPTNMIGSPYHEKKKKVPSILFPFPVTGPAFLLLLSASLPLCGFSSFLPASGCAADTVLSNSRWLLVCPVLWPLLCLHPISPGSSHSLSFFYARFFLGVHKKERFWFAYFSDYTSSGSGGFSALVFHLKRGISPRFCS